MFVNFKDNVINLNNIIYVKIDDLSIIVFFNNDNIIIDYDNFEDLISEYRIFLEKAL